MKRRRFLGRLLAALGVFATGVNSRLFGGVPVSTPTSPPSPPWPADKAFPCNNPKNPLKHQLADCQFCRDRYNEEAAGCPRCGGAGVIPARGSLGDMSRVMGHREDGRIPDTRGLVFKNQPCPRCQHAGVHPPIGIYTSPAA